MDIDEAQKDVISARQQSAVVEESIKQAKAWLTARKEAAALISAAAIIEKDNTTLRNEIAATRLERTNVAKNFKSSIERARNELVGTTLSEVALSSGQRLKNAKIQSLDEEITVFQHSEGVSKIPTAELPAEIQDRLRYGFNPGGIGTISKDRKETSSITSASDRVARLGMSNAPAASTQGDDEAGTPPATSSAAPSGSAPVAGQIQSLGRVYTPGKGWERVGASGTAAPPALGTSSPFRKNNPEAVSKVKNRAEMKHQTGQ
jgi:hypothetical protein